MTAVLQVEGGGYMISLADELCMLLLAAPLPCITSVLSSIYGQNAHAEAPAALAAASNSSHSRCDSRPLPLFTWFVFIADFICQRQIFRKCLYLSPPSARPKRHFTELQAKSAIRKYTAI